MTPDSQEDTGSSPHTRGAPVAAERARLDSGIIPAYAGSTPTPCTSWASIRDHPRIRGEHSALACLHLPHQGSSPHTRGARDGGTQNLEAFGIIPAYAGSTLKYLVII